jgi:hypothetical protein
MVTTGRVSDHHPAVGEFGGRITQRGVMRDSHDRGHPVMGEVRSPFGLVC